MEIDGLRSAVMLFEQRYLDADPTLDGEREVITRTKDRTGHNVPNAATQPVTEFRVAIRRLPVRPFDRHPAQNRQTVTLESELPVVYDKAHGAELLTYQHLQRRRQIVCHRVILPSFPYVVTAHHQI